MATPTKPIKQESGRATSLYSVSGAVTWIEDDSQKGPSIAPTPGLVKFMRQIGKAFPGMGKGGAWTDEQKDQLAFLGWDLKASDFHATATFFGYIFTFLLALFILLVWVQSVPILDSVLIPNIGPAEAWYGNLLVQHVVGFALVLASLFFAKLLMLALFGTFISGAVQKERALALGYIPEIVNYFVMSMRLSPNLEKAVEFAATHGRGKIADDLKTLIYYVQIGKWESVEEGLDDLAYRWGNVNDDFKHALMLIRGSLLEADKTRREQLLEKAATDVLEGSKEKMDLYARALHAPTVYLYYFGILLPLMLAIILPIGASLTGGKNALPIAGAPVMFVLYNLLIPAGVYLFGGLILSGRPPTYVPPNIPATFPGLPPKGTTKIAGIPLPTKLLAVLVFAACLGTGLFIDAGIKASIPSFSLADELANLPHIAFFDSWGLFVSQFTIFGFLIGIALGVSAFYQGEYGARKKIQDEIRSMEVEFKDAMYVLASRLGENRPIEDAMKHAMEFLPKSKLANTVFRKIVDNITQMGMTLENAIFDHTYGAVRLLPSQTIRSGLRIMVDSVGLGVNVAAKSLISLALQLRDQQRIDEGLRRLLEDVTTMLSTMATFIAPVVLAVVASMQQLIIHSLASAGTAGAGTSTAAPASTGIGLGGFSSLISADATKNTADPASFALIMGIYVLEVVWLLTYFNAQIEDTNNPLHTFTSIAKNMPVAAILYCAAIYLVGGAIGGAH